MARENLLLKNRNLSGKMKNAMQFFLRPPNHSDNESFHWNCRKSQFSIARSHTGHRQWQSANMWKRYIKMLFYCVAYVKCVQTSGAWNFILSINYPNNLYSVIKCVCLFCFPLFLFIRWAMVVSVFCCWCSRRCSLFTQTDVVVVRKVTRRFFSVEYWNMKHHDNCSVCFNVFILVFTPSTGFFMKTLNFCTHFQSQLNQFN